MGLSTTAEPVPFRIDAHGVARVGGTRVPLEVLVGLYRMGNSAEELHDQFPSVTLADIYAVIAYSLRHPEEVDEYLRVAAEESEAAQGRLESRPGYTEEMKALKERLLARRRQTSSD